MMLSVLFHSLPYFIVQNRKAVGIHNPIGLTKSFSSGVDICDCEIETLAQLNVQNKEIK